MAAERRSFWREGTLDQIIRATCKACLDENGGNYRAAAADLGIAHTTLYRLLGVTKRAAQPEREVRT